MGQFDFYGEIVPDGYADVLAALVDGVQLTDRIKGELHSERDRRQRDRMREVVYAITPTVIEMIENSCPTIHDEHLRSTLHEAIAVLEESAPPYPPGHYTKIREWWERSVAVRARLIGFAGEPPEEPF